MEEKPDRQVEPTAASLSDRPRERRWSRGTVFIGVFVTAFLLMSSPLFFNGCLLVGWQTQLTLDRLNGPMLLKNTISTNSPDGKIKIEVDRDGTARLIRVADGRILYVRRISPEEYKAVEAVWQQDNKHAQVICAVRYPAMATQMEYLWDSQSGVVTDAISHEIADFK